MGFFSEIKSGLKEIFSEIGEKASFRGQEYTCAITQGENALELESGGLVPSGNFNLKFLEEELGSIVPKVGEIITYNNIQYRIVWVSNRRNRGQIEVQVKPKDK